MKKPNYRLAFAILASLIDEVLLVVAAAWLLPLLGFELPLWSIVILAVIFLGLGVLIYLLMSKQPSLGFESQIGARGVAVTRIVRKGTVRIGHEMWAAATTGNPIEEGIPVLVVGQNALILTVISENSN